MAAPAPGPGSPYRRRIAAAAGPIAARSPTAGSLSGVSATTPLYDAIDGGAAAATP